MLSDRVQRQIDRLLDQAEKAIALRQWEDLRATCEVVLNLDPENSDATQYLALADKSLATDVASDSSDIVEPSEDPAPAANTPPPVAPQDAEPEDRPDTNPIDSRTSGQRVRDLAVANSKLAREQSEFGAPVNPAEVAGRSSRESSRRQVRRQVQERIRLGQRANAHKDGLETNPSDSKTFGQRVRDLAVANSAVANAKLALELERANSPRRQIRRQVQETLNPSARATVARELQEQRAAAKRRGDEQLRIRREQTRQASSPRSRNLDSGNARSPSDSQTLFNQLIGTSGRINRAGYIVRAIATSVATGVAVVFMVAGPAGVLIGLVLYIAVLVVAFCSAVRRCHDFNWGGASLLLLLIPPFGLMLLFRSGTRGTNNHGHEPVDLAVGF
jgi:uncharacterized membrane protein YhaH (DUF805 family)